jgi:hypothetical protein
MVWLNVASSSIFITNAAAAWYFKDKFYAMLFALLVVTSFLAHGFDHPAFTFIDKVVVYSVVVYGGYKFVNKKFGWKNVVYSFISVITFLTVVAIYFGNASFDKTYGTTFHALLHLFSSLGHHCILLI